jgi:hypothetical protein
LRKVSPLPKAGCLQKSIFLCDFSLDLDSLNSEVEDSSRLRKACVAAEVACVPHGSVVQTGTGAPKRSEGGLVLVVVLRPRESECFTIGLTEQKNCRTNGGLCRHRTPMHRERGRRRGRKRFSNFGIWVKSASSSSRVVNRAIRRWEYKGTFACSMIIF